ncbi:MAG: PDZ domain-containing protein, partial [Chitinivibrionales bacterium]|nr:PDZ domain-containing protein [Chitinivibrionales bacterium]
VLIADVFKGQPAEKAGIKAGDVIISIDGVRVENVNELRNTVASINPGKQVPIEIIRGGGRKVIKARLGDRDEKEVKKIAEEEEMGDSGAEVDETKTLGIKVSDINDDLRSKFSIGKSTDGVVVVEIDRYSQAAREGIRPGDVIKEIRIKGRKAATVSSAKEFKKLTRGLKEGDSVMFLIERGGSNRFVAFKLRD